MLIVSAGACALPTHVRTVITPSNKQKTARMYRFDLISDC
jgi:hypothetical protein